MKYCHIFNWILVIKLFDGRKRINLYLVKKCHILNINTFVMYVMNEASSNGKSDIPMPEIFVILSTKLQYSSD